jgi:hypothetical protein
MDGSFAPRYEDRRRLIGFVEGAGKLSDGDRKAVLGGNAVRLLNIPIKVRS